MRSRTVIASMAFLGLFGVCVPSGAESRTPAVMKDGSHPAAFTCQGRAGAYKVPPTRKAESKDDQQAEMPAREPALIWSCRAQSKVQKAFNDLRIPLPKGGPMALEDAMALSARINRAAGTTLNKDCACTYDPSNKQTGKPLIACSCVGTYQEPKQEKMR